MHYPGADRAFKSAGYIALACLIFIVLVAGGTLYILMSK